MAWAFVAVLGFAVLFLISLYRRATAGEYATGCLLAMTLADDQVYRGQQAELRKTLEQYREREDLALTGAALKYLCNYAYKLHEAGFFTKLPLTLRGFY